MNNNENTFQPFPKMARLSRECVITEKIDGTNAQIFVWDRQHILVSGLTVGDPPDGIPWVWSDQNISIAAGSKNRWLTTEKNADNYSFARWVQDNAPVLKSLGHGRHFGEWWGAGIQRRYGLAEKRFSLFNVERWQPLDNNRGVLNLDTLEIIPCCHVVPVLFRGDFKISIISGVLSALEAGGSVAAPGFMDPEGIVIYHTAARTMFKKTIKDDESPKSVVDKAAASAIVHP